MARRVCIFLGMGFVFLGFAWFLEPHSMVHPLWMHLTPMHDLVHVLSGAVALYLGTRSSDRAVRTFCIAFGAFYLLLGVLGFVAPGVLASILAAGNPALRDAMAAPGELTPDNIVHLLLGAVFLGVGLTTARAVAEARA